jgi:hypothetical protein
LETGTITHHPGSAASAASRHTEEENPMSVLDLQALETPARDTRWNGGDSETSLLLCNSSVSFLLCL